MKAIKLTALAALISVSSVAMAQLDKPKQEMPVIVKTECRTEIDVQICRIHFADGTWKEVSEPLGTMRNSFINPEKLVAVEQTITGGVYRDIEAAAQSLGAM